MPTVAELDAQVTEKLMGSPKHKWVKGLTTGDILGDYEGCQVCETSRKPERETETCVRPYSSEIASAMEVVKKVLERKWWMFDFRSFSPGEGMVWFCDTLSATGKDMQARFKSLEELPRAICEAALKTIDGIK